MQNKDYLSGTSIYLRQRKDMFRCNTDTALLGHFMKVNKEESVLDIGCNNGALMLYASRFPYAHLYGIDIFKEALDLAKENLEDNEVKEYTLIHGDVTEVNLPQVEVIVCNPPYFDTDVQGNRNENLFLQRARHEDSLNLNSLFSIVNTTLKEQGRFYLVHRASRIYDILVCAATYQLRPKVMQLMYDEDKEEAISILLEFSKEYLGQVQILKPKIITR